jgi:hypothetical protein
VKRTTTFHVDFIYVCLSLEHYAKLWEMERGEEDFVGGRDVGFFFFFISKFLCQGWGRCICSTPNHTTAGWERACEYAAFFSFLKQMIMEKVSIFIFPSRDSSQVKQLSVQLENISQNLLIFFFYISLKLFFFHSKTIFCCFFSPQAGFPHHLPPAQAHLTGTPDWRVLNNRPFPPSQYFHHHPHFATHNVLAAIDRMERPFLDGSECR